MEQTVARFYVAESTEFGQPDENGQCSGNVVLRAVSRGDQNKQWSSATPVGELKMTINNPPAFEAIRAIQRNGLDVELLLTPVVAHAPGDGHPFRQSSADNSSYYGREGLCGDCGFMRRNADGAFSHQSDIDAE